MSANRLPRLLVTGGGGAATEALYRMLGRLYEIHFADADREARPPTVSRQHWHHIPMASAPDFLGALNRLCEDLQTDLLVPGVDEELSAIAHGRNAFPCGVLLPPASFVDVHLDKLASQAHLKTLGVPVPETESLPLRNRVGFPCVVKPRTGRGSRQVAVVRSEEELQAHVVLCRRPPEDFIAQELLEGDEYTVTVVADTSGHLRAVVPVKVAIKRGITLRASTTHDDAVLTACVSIHAAHPVSGCFNIQLIRTAAGVVKPFEVNPRVSTTTCLALAAGVDFVDLYRSEAPVPPAAKPGLAPFEEGLQLKRSWANEFVHMAPTPVRGAE